MRPNRLASLGSSLAIVSLVVGACSSGAVPSAAPASPGATLAPAAATATPAPTAAPIVAHVSPAGTHNGRIAYGVKSGSASNLFSVKADGTGLVQLTKGSGNHLCAAYSADGSSIAYCADQSGNFEIWTMKADGSAQTQLTHLGGTALFPDISRDGKKVAFGGTEGDDSHTEVYVVDAASGTGLVALTSCASSAPAGCANDYPVWSPDGGQIAYIHQDDIDANDVGVNQQVWVMNVDGSNQHPLTSGGAPKDQVPDWSPDGTKIAYATGAASNEGIWVMGADGSGQVQVSGCHAGDASPCAAGDDFAPAWSPDGTKIAFLRSFQDVGKNDRSIYVMNADGSGQTRLIKGDILQTVPAWQSRSAGQTD